MGVRIFIDDNWERIMAGVISFADIIGLDQKRDQYLIDWLIIHMDETKMNKARQKFDFKEAQKEFVNIDDPDDEIYGIYQVVKEQVQRENNIDVLKEAAFREHPDILSRFAFCRLTGYSYPADENDAYSYRTYYCGRNGYVTRKDVEDFCREMIDRNGSFVKEAEETLSHLSEMSFNDEKEDWTKDIPKKKES